VKVKIGSAPARKAAACDVNGVNTVLDIPINPACAALAIVRTAIAPKILRLNALDVIFCSLFRGPNLRIPA